MSALLLYLGLLILRAVECIQFSSVAQSCLTLCDPMGCSMPGLPILHQLLELTQTHVHWVSDAAAAAAAKSIQSCPTLCNPIDSSPPGSPIPGIFQRSHGRHSDGGYPEGSWNQPCVPVCVCICFSSSCGTFHINKSAVNSSIVKSIKEFCSKIGIIFSVASFLTLRPVNCHS